MARPALHVLKLSRWLPVMGMVQSGPFNHRYGSGAPIDGRTVDKIRDFG